MQLAGLKAGEQASTQQHSGCEPGLGPGYCVDKAPSSTTNAGRRSDTLPLLHAGIAGRPGSLRVDGLIREPGSVEHAGEAQGRERVDREFRSILMAAVIGAAAFVRSEPEIVGFLTGVDSEGYTSDGAIFGLPGQPRMPEVFITGVFGAMELVLWVARVVIVLFIVMAVTMLRVEEPAPAGKPAATLARYIKQSQHYTVPMFGSKKPEKTCGPKG